MAVSPQGWQNLQVILVFCAFGAEFGPLRARLRDSTHLGLDGLVGSRGRVGKHRVALVKTGVGMRRARETAGRVLDALRNVDLVATTGVAGALQSGLEVGGVILADRLMTRREESFHAQRVLEVPPQPFRTFSHALEAGGIVYSAGGLLTSRRAIATVADKRLAAAQSGAVAVDMESAVIAEEAHRRGLPFVCLRTILDAAGDELAGAALADENGRVRLFAAAKTMVTNPSMLVGAARLMRNLRTSTRILAAVTESVLQRVE
jgi:adenosylhomocysteine nucleosidase